ncbi:flagellar hook-length control protein FliK [Methyloterricola oryzae]|uniref:flagellar hook-length control protein FliK n=1 Tax=Methyloterricola oryzae TaxID=1495050 RepID=UPI00069A7754|nr:flagellar hook-length control protein FliK [Methyloterricola oryzae]
MEIRLTTALQPIQPSKAISSLLERLRPGENISAVVEAQLAEDSFLLKLSDGGETLRARSQLNLTPGQTLKLEVVKLGTTPELKIVPQEAAQTQDSPETVAIQQAFRQFLPKQLQLADLASGLREALKPPAAEAAPPLPEPLRNLVKSVLDALPQKSGLVTPDGLKQAAEDSGLFLEARLAAQPEAAAQLSGRDLKGNLLALNEALKVLIKSAEGKPAPAPTAPTAPQPTGAETGADAKVTDRPSSAPQPAATAKPTAPGTALLPQAAADAGKTTAGPAANTPTGARPLPAEPEARAPISPALAAKPEEITQRAESAALPEVAKPSGSSPPPMTDGQAAATPGKTAILPESAHAGAAPKPGETGSGKPQPEAPPASSTPPPKTAPELPAALRDNRVIVQLASQLPLPEAPQPAAGERAQAAPPAATAPEAQVPQRQEPTPRAEPPFGKDTAVRTQATLPPPNESALNEALTIKSLHQRTEGAIARIVLDQLASLPQAEGKPMVWQMEIPFTDDGRSDTAKLKVVRENPHEAQSGQAFWSVILELSPPGLGTIHSRINLCGDYVNTYFWSDEGSTAHLIQDHLDLLAARMQQAGLNVGEINTLPGAPAEGTTASPPATTLVDERA